MIDFLPRLAEVKYADSFVSLPSPSFSQGGPKARESSPARPLDLDHLGAEVGQVLAGPRPGEHARQIEHPDMRKRTGHELRFRF